MPAVLTDAQRMKKRRAIAKELGICQKCFSRDAMPVKAGQDWPRRALCGVCDEAQEDYRVGQRPPAMSNSSATAH